MLVGQSFCQSVTQ